MKQIRLLIALACCWLALVAAPAVACINVELNIGVIDSPQGRLMAEMISTLILERSGVRADLHYFKNAKELDEAAADKKVDILVEEVGQALAVLGEQSRGNAADDLMTVKILYKRDKGLIWLKPFGYEGKDGIAGMVVSKEILDKFPGMPRVLGKLSGAIDNATRDQLMQRVADGDKPAAVAKDFLVAKRFI